MLEKIREGSQGMIAKVILGFVILTFALAGVGSYLGNTSEVPVATVNGDEITKVQFDTAYQNERARMQQQFGEMFGMLSADSNYMSNFRNSVLGGKVRGDRVYMPAFAGILNQEAIWAIKAYVETRPAE